MARLLMVLSSFSPLFLLWAMQRVGPITYLDYTIMTSKQWLITCLILATVPTAVLFLRYRIAKRNNDRVELVAVRSDDHSEHLLTYLVANLLPFYSSPINSIRSLATVICAIAFVVFIMWRMNLHYINLFFAFMGYKAYTITLNEADGRKVILLSKRNYITTGTSVRGIRLSNTVFIEPNNHGEV
ncbi:MAG: hypothetical protein GFGODING_02539 [Flavobacteriales bacterium]|nr:hypothetical protein [Flavobacteriales bacterium]